MMSLLQILLLHNTRITTRIVPKVIVKIISFSTKMVIDTNQVEAQMVDQIKDIKIIILNVHNVSCGKFSHTVISCYHRFDIDFQGLTTTNNFNTLHKSSNNNTTQMQAMLAFPSTTNDEAWFFDTRVTYHLTPRFWCSLKCLAIQGKRSSDCE